MKIQFQIGTPAEPGGDILFSIDPAYIAAIAEVHAKAAIALLLIAQRESVGDIGADMPYPIHVDILYLLDASGQHCRGGCDLVL